MGNWRLGDYVIHEFKDGELRWGTWMDEDPPGLSFFTGWARVDQDTLVMSSWKVRTAAKEKNWEEVKETFESLPQWDRTTYWVKLADIGMSGLMDCQTLEPAPDEIAECIMPKLGFTRSKVELP